MPFYRISDMEAVRATVGPATAKTAHELMLSGKFLGKIVLTP